MQRSSTMIAPIEGFCNIHIEPIPEARKLTVKMRLDHLLVQRGLASSRTKAQDMIRRGAVRAKGAVILKAGLEIPENEPLEVLETERFVARSAWKLLAAIDAFGFDAAGRVCLDIGASTGGFTQVLLERGAARVFAVDVGRDQLHPSLRSNERVTSLESTDARALTPGMYSEPFTALTCDVSFISVLKVLPALFPLAAEDAWLVALVKPQFEVGRALVGKGGIVRDEAAKRDAIARAVDAVSAAGWQICGTLPSPILGRYGNEETLLGAIRRA
jgi:23S rRNA (cytidine1920-2'-O)/16S rRNA (cytidine1409-2'-O)-methyltransferase